MNNTRKTVALLLILLCATHYSNAFMPRSVFSEPLAMGMQFVAFFSLLSVAKITIWLTKANEFIHEKDEQNDIEFEFISLPAKQSFISFDCMGITFDVHAKPISKAQPFSVEYESQLQDQIGRGIYQKATRQLERQLQSLDKEKDWQERTEINVQLSTFDQWYEKILQEKIQETDEALQDNKEIMSKYEDKMIKLAKVDKQLKKEKASFKQEQETIQKKIKQRYEEQGYLLPSVPEDLFEDDESFDMLPLPSSKLCDKSDEFKSI